MYVGTYTSGASKGIYTFRFNSSTGKASEPGLAAENSNPSFLAVHPNRRFLYAVNENPNGTVSAFSIGERLALLNSVSSRGAGPCHVAIDRTGKWLFVANYNSGSVAVFPIGSDGRLGESVTFVQHSGSSVNRQRQERPHAHEVAVSADNRFVLVPDLGADQVVLYRSMRPRTGRLGHGIPLPERNPIRAANEINAARRFHGSQERGRDRSPSQRQVSLRFEPRSRQHRDVSNRSGQGHSDRHGPCRDAREDTAQLRDRSWGCVPCWRRIRTPARSWFSGSIRRPEV